MIISFITIPTDDIQASAAFYTKVMGFEVVRQFSPQDGVEIVFLQDDAEKQIELIQAENQPTFNHDRTRISIGFDVDDLDEIEEKLKSHGVNIVEGPFQLPNGTRLMQALDPTGVRLGFIES